jgi:hypothetical protein
MESFNLVIRYRCRDAFDEQMEAFEDDVWDRVREQFGRQIEGVGEEQYIEWISAEHRDTVVALVLDGLRRYG